MDKREKDREILRELAKRYAEIAALPTQDEKRRLWRALNGLRPERPMVAIDQACWEQADAGGGPALRCEDDECRRYEAWLRRTLLQWELFPADMVVEPVVRVERAIYNVGLAVGGAAVDGMDAEAATPGISHDEAETRRRMDFAEWLFNGVGLELRLEGVDPRISIWDPIAAWLGAEGAPGAPAGEPSAPASEPGAPAGAPGMAHALAARLAAGYMSMLDQLESLGLLCHSQPLIGCSGAYAEELPAPGFDPNRPRTKDLWMHWPARPPSAASPALPVESEASHMMPIFERFGLVHCSCPSPADGGLELIRRIPHLRKASFGPSADPARCAHGIGRDFVYSCNPDAALVAAGTFDEDAARAELLRAKEACARHGCPLEFIMKGDGAARAKPELLKKWADAAMSVACS